MKWRQTTLAHLERQTQAVPRAVERRLTITTTTIDGPTGVQMMMNIEHYFFFIALFQGLFLPVTDGNSLCAYDLNATQANLTTGDSPHGEFRLDGVEPIAEVSQTGNDVAVDRSACASNSMGYHTSFRRVPVIWLANWIRRKFEAYDKPGR